MGKHLTIDDRWEIESGIKRGLSFSKIAICLNKSTSTISREVKRYSIPSNKSAVGRIPNRCIHRTNCFKSFLCENNLNCNKLRCSTCKKCNTICPDFVEEHCPNLKKPPYVCNGCKTEHRCTLRKRYYIHTLAQKAYEETLSSCREGFNVNEQELANINKILTPLVKKGQSLRHIYITNQNRLTVCLKTLYRYVDAGLLEVRNIDLLRKCRIKPRRRKSRESKIDRKCRVNRTYSDYLRFLEENPDTAIVQMDSVLGTRGGKVLLTLYFKNSAFMLAFLREQNDAQSVIDIFNNLYSCLGREDFLKLFPVILTDNGTEFSNPLALEFDGEGRQRTRVFYCDPRSPQQRGEGERNHGLIRQFIPKGTSMNHLSQENITDMANNINSYVRESLNDKTPYEVFAYLYGQRVLDKLGAVLIPSKDVVLNSSIFKK